MFREERDRKQKVDQIVEQQAAPIVKAIESVKPKEPEPSESINISDFVEKTEIVYDTNYGVNLGAFKRLMVDFKNNGLSPC